MPRKVIIGVIGATHRNGEPVPREVLCLARSVGREIGTRDAILLTGGEPNEEDRSVKSFAMLGCKEATQNGRPSGRMISVLPKPAPLPYPLPHVDRVPGSRRIVLQTTLSSMGRNLITGGTPDRMIVLCPGKGGTLVELAFARWDNAVAPVFVQAVQRLRRQSEKQERQTPDKILANIIKAMTEFRVDGDPAALRRALSDRLRTAQDTAATAEGAANSAIAGVPAQIVPRTQFEGHPSAEIGSSERLLKDEFEDSVEKLSDLQPGAVF